MTKPKPTLRILTDYEREAAVRVGTLLADRVTLSSPSESELDEILFWTTQAIGLMPGHYIPFRLKVYKTVLEHNADYAQRLVDSFRREIAVCAE